MNQATMHKYAKAGSRNDNNQTTSDENNNADNNNLSGHRQKRGRTELEPEQTDDNNGQLLRVPNIRGADNDVLSPTESTSSLLFSSESAITVTGQQEDVPPIESVNRVQNNDNDANNKMKAVRLERLRDKSDRYSSHIEFLKECRQNQVIPKGLRIDVEPSIGNNDDDFCAKWFARLNEFSLTLISDIIEYCEETENVTAERITTATEKLKADMDPEDL